MSESNFGRQRSSRLARDSRLGAAGQLWYRVWWGARPVPARLERALHRARWRGAQARGDA